MGKATIKEEEKEARWMAGRKGKKIIRYGSLIKRQKRKKNMHHLVHHSRKQGVWTKIECRHWRKGALSAIYLTHLFIMKTKRWFTEK